MVLPAEDIGPVTAVGPSSVRWLLEAKSLDQLRERLHQLVAHHGFFGVFECSESLSFTDGSPPDIEIHWGDLNQKYGRSTEEILRAVHAAQIGLDLVEINERQWWMAGQRGPFLLQGHTPKVFQVTLERAKVPLDFGEPMVSDTLMVPIGMVGPKIRHLSLPTETRPSLRDTAAGVSLANIYKLIEASLERGGTERHARPDPAVELTAKELTVLRWAAAGKSLEDIAVLTGFGYRTVRYHLDQARERYGYATVQQTIVRAAQDYGLDPLGR